MANFGGFDHNAQTIRLLTHLENKYADFDGLNLTWEVLEGIAKHNGPLVGHGKKPIPRALKYYADQQDLELASYASAEAQVAAIA
ncbi:deoxyguanosinetriphosphate triphosphohydrolase, partial [Campylobacter coli]